MTHQMPRSASFVLYLRPFSSDRINVRNPFRSGMILAPSYHSEAAKIPLSALLTRLCGRTPLIQFGGSPDHPGPGKIVVPDTLWKGKLEALLPHATAIIVTALYGDATAWETEQIVSRRLLERSAFIIPDLPSLGKDQGRNFTKMVEFSRSIGLEFPSQESNIVIWFDEDKRKRTASLGKRSLVRWLER